MHGSHRHHTGLVWMDCAAQAIMGKPLVALCGVSSAVVRLQTLSHLRSR